jgi:hypothetical protein
MVHDGQRLPLGLETTEYGLAIHSWFDQFDGDGTPNGFVLFCDPDGPHASFAYFSDQRVAIADVWHVFGTIRPIRWGPIQPLNEPEGSLIGRQQGLDFPPQPLITAAGLIQEAIAFIAQRDFGCLKKQVAYGSGHQ